MYIPVCYVAFFLLGQLINVVYALMIVITCSIGRVDSSMKFNPHGSSMESSTTNTTDQISFFYGNVIDIKGTMNV